MLNVLAIFIGGGLGSVVRYLTSCAYLKWCNFPLPLATFSVNIIGSFVLGALLMFLRGDDNIPEAVKFALTVGFCGGLTTFSAFSLEVFDFIKREQYLIAFLYIILSVLVTVLAAAGGYFWAKSYV